MRLLRGMNFIYVYCILNLQNPVVTICTASLTFKILRSAHIVYLCVLYGSENKERLFPNTAITDLFL